MFVTSVGALLVLSIPDLRPAPCYISEFYLENIYQVLAGSDDLRTPITSIVTQPRAPPFSPPRYAVWVNSLWSLSFVISLSCGLLATLVQRWARRFIQNTHLRHYSLEKQARMRTLFANGADNMYTSRVIDGTTSLLHFSVFLFLVGFAIYLFNIDYTTSRSMIWWIALSSTVYGCISLVPIFRHDTPYSTPLSAPAWSLYTGMRYVISECLTSNAYLSKKTLWGFRDTSNPYFRWFWGGVEEAAADAAMSSKIELEILDRSVGVLRDSNEQEGFFELIPRLFKSKLERVLPTDVPLTLRTKFRKALDEFLDHTLSSESVSQSDKIRRLVIGLNAMHVIPGPDSVSEILRDILKGRWVQASQSVWVNTLPGWCRSEKESIAIFARCILARILVSVRRRNERWIKLAVDHLGFPELGIRNYIGHGDSVSLSILNHITRQTFRSSFWTPEMLSPLCNFDAHDSFPELRHEFCDLWNEILDEAWKKGDHTTPVEVLREIRNIFAALHQGHEAPSDQLFATVTRDDELLRLRSAYPYCRIASHRTIPPAPATTSSTVAVAHLHPRVTLPRPISAWKRGRPVHLDNPSTASHRHIPVESQSTLGLGSTPRQTDITPRPFLYEDFTPSRTPGSQSPPLNVDPVYTGTAQEVQVVEVTDADHSESIGLRTFRVNEDVHKDPRKDPPLLRHPVYSDAGFAAADIVPPDHQTPQHTSDTGVTSQAPVVSLHVFQDPETVEATIMPSTGTNPEPDLPPSSTVLAITKPCDHTPPHTDTPPSPPLATTSSVHGKHDQQQLVRTKVSAQSNADTAENISPPGSLTSQIHISDMGESNQASEATFCAPSGPDPLPVSASTIPSTGPELPITGNTIPHLTVASPIGDDTEITDPQL